MVDSKDVKLCFIGVLTLIYFLVTIVVSHLTHSLTLLTNSYQMLYNILSLLGCVVSLKLSREKSLRNTFGWARIEVLGMMMSILFLAALCFSVLVEAFQTLAHLDHQDAMHHPLIVLIISGAGIILNLLCFFMLGGYTHEQGCFLCVEGQNVIVNVVMSPEQASLKDIKRNSIFENTNTKAKPSPRATFALDFFRDIAGSVIVAICSSLVYFFGGEVALYSDPLLSIVAVIILMSSSYPFFKQSGMILLETIPENIDVNSLKERLLENFPSILNVHDLHVWRLTRDKIIATCHVICESPKDYAQISGLIDHFFHCEGIPVATIQPEFIKTDTGSPIQSTECILDCGKGSAKCQAPRCCHEGNATCRSSPTSTASGVRQRRQSVELSEVKPTSVPAQENLQFVTTV